MRSKAALATGLILINLKSERKEGRERNSNIPSIVFEFFEWSR